MDFWGQLSAAYSDEDPDQDEQALKPHSTHAIIRWMENNYQLEEGICLPRSTIYEHYQDYCQKAQIQPVNAASFGKIIRQQFPTLTTRRLGTRGQSKYHYFGLGIKPTSFYYKVESAEEQSSSGCPKKDAEHKKEKPSAILSSFPDVNLLKIPESISKEKLHTFMVMYKAHCQRILDSVVRANFAEVESFLQHFWQGMPTHLLPVLATSMVVDLVAFCDSVLYGVIRDVLIASPLQSCPESLAQEMVKFSSTLVRWLEAALKGLPEALQNAKYKLASNFARSLKRQTQLMNLAQAARSALNGEDSLVQLRKDWSMMDLQLILANTLFTLERQQIPMEYLCFIPHFLQEFAELIESRTSLEDFTMWADSVVDKCVRNAQNTCNLTLRQLGKIFLLTWKYFTSKVAREFTLQSAPSFGTFHLLHILIDDYIVHSLESAAEEEEEQVYKRRIDTLSLAVEKATILPTRTSVPLLHEKDATVDQSVSCAVQQLRSIGGVKQPLMQSYPPGTAAGIAVIDGIDAGLGRRNMQGIEATNHCKEPLPPCPAPCPTSSPAHSLSFYSSPERIQVQSPEIASMGGMANKMPSRGGFEGCQPVDTCPSSRPVCAVSSLGNAGVPSLPMSNTGTTSISSLSAAGIPLLPPLPSVPSMYSYGYTSLSGLAGVPTQPLSAGIFQTQSGLSVPGYPYLPPSFYTNINFR